MATGSRTLHTDSTEPLIITDALEFKVMFHRVYKHRQSGTFINGEFSTGFQFYI